MLRYTERPEMEASIIAQCMIVSTINGQCPNMAQNSESHESMNGNPHLTHARVCLVVERCDRMGVNCTWIQ